MPIKTHIKIIGAETWNILANVPAVWNSGCVFFAFITFTSSACRILDAPWTFVLFSHAPVSPAWYRLCQLVWARPHKNGLISKLFKSATGRISRFLQSVFHYHGACAAQHSVKRQATRLVQAEMCKKDRSHRRVHYPDINVLLRHSLRYLPSSCLSPSDGLLGHKVTRLKLPFCVSRLARSPFR